MTYLYEWYSLSNKFSVRCPGCNCEATVQEIERWPLNFANKKRRKLASSEGFHCKVSCLNCGYSKSTVVSWPSYAYWQCSIKGKVLWAWSREHLSTIKRYLQSNERDAFKFENTVSLLYIPKHFKLVRNRSAAIKSIDNLLNENTY